MSDKPLSPRHLRFVLEYLKDGNATQAYIRAGYAPRHAQSCASRLLAQPSIAAAVAAGQQRLAQALKVDAQRLGQEYAKIAFANIKDYIEVEADGQLRIDIDKASQAQAAGLLEVVVTHGRQSQTVRLKLGKLKALAMLTRHLGLFARKPAQETVPEDRARLDEEIAALRRQEAHERSERERLQRELDAARLTLAEAQAKIGQTGREAPEEDEPPPTPVEEGPRRPPIVRWPTEATEPSASAMADHDNRDNARCQAKAFSRPASRSSTTASITRSPL